MKRILITLSLVITLLISSNKTYAWGNKGHVLVAQLAFHYLDETTKKNVMTYLKGMSIEEAANWMDNVRSDHKYDFQKPYHYADFEKKETVSEGTEDNIIKILNQSFRDLDQIKTLSDEEIKTKLLYLFHLVGDLNQPMHVGYRSDKGGNSVKVLFNGRLSNLHSIWDTAIIESRGTTMADCLQSVKYTPAQMASLRVIDITGWAKDSRSFLTKAYDIKNNKITEGYADEAYPVIEEQLLKGGIRLASVLEHYFKNIENRAVLASVSKSDEILVIAKAEAKAIEEIPTIDVSKVGEYEGKLVKVCSKVFSSKFLESTKAQPTFLNVGADYPSSPLTIVIWGANRNNFKNKVENYYKGKDICITGKVIMFNGKPEIIASKESDIIVK